MLISTFVENTDLKGARMMMDKRSTKGVRARRVQQLLSELGVNSCTKTKLKALSGGERKRVSLAVQLLNDPPILFCDEPTTGLDSWAAAAVVGRLRKLAIGGKLVVCSVHQPASGVFELFHQVVLLANGRIAFHGTIEQADTFFASLNYKCPLGFNAAEYYISLLGIQADKEMESRDRIRRICDEYSRSDIAAEIDSKVGNVKDETEYFNGETDEKDQYYERYVTLVKVNYFVQFYWLMWRNVQALKRNYSIWIAEFFLLMFVGLIISVPYHGHFDELDQRDIQNVEGLLYLTITETIFLFIYAVFITFPSEVPILLRETASGLYSPLPYYLSKMIFWIPRAVIEPTLFTTLIFLIAGLHGGFMGWLGFNFVCILCANYANAYGSFLSATFNSMETAALVSVPFELVGTMFSGLYLNLASVSPYLSWLRYISGFYYGVESISILQWDSIETIDCVVIDGMPCIRTGPEVLRRFGYAEEHFWRNCLCSFLSATFDKMETAALISVPYDLIGLMFSGIYLNLATAPPYFSWLRYISGFYYGTECISVLQWTLVDTINCVNAEGLPCIRTGAGVLTRFGYEEKNFWRNCACLVTLYCVGNIIAYAMVVKRSRGTPVY
uniref:ABC transporter domain-containing protein n=1 Tax=Heliothis virescens TaxID=7102 RepID=A0A2A4JDG4_HELVI